jgi:hypothetical protein
MNTGPRVPATVGFRTVRFFGALLSQSFIVAIFVQKFEDLVDKTALIKSLKEPEDTIGDGFACRQ